MDRHSPVEKISEPPQEPILALLDKSLLLYSLRTRLSFPLERINLLNSSTT